MEMKDFSLTGLSKSTCKTVLNKVNVWWGKQSHVLLASYCFFIITKQVSLLFFFFSSCGRKPFVSPSVCFHLTSNLCKIFTLENEKDNSPPPPLFQETSGLC